MTRFWEDRYKEGAITGGARSILPSKTVGGGADTRVTPVRTRPPAPVLINARQYVPIF